MSRAAACVVYLREHLLPRGFSTTDRSTVGAASTCASSSLAFPPAWR
jgi:hypothetical protein